MVFREKAEQLAEVIRNHRKIIKKLLNCVFWSCPEGMTAFPWTVSYKEIILIQSNVSALTDSLRSSV